MSRHWAMGAARHPRGHCREHDVRPRRALGAESASDVFRQDVHGTGVKREQGGHALPDRVGALVGIEDRQLAAAPRRRRGVWLHWVVLLGRARPGYSSQRANCT